VHLLAAGFDGTTAAFALGMVAFFGIFGQIGLGALSDRIGREKAWTIGLSGFGATTVLLVLLEGVPSPVLLWAMVIAQGLIGNGVTSMFGAMPAELFQGRNFPTIFSMITVMANIGAASGVYALGLIRDLTGDYDIGWWLCLGLVVLSGVAIWAAAPRRVRVVAGVAKRRAAAAAE